MKTVEKSHQSVVSELSPQRGECVRQCSVETDPGEAGNTTMSVHRTSLLRQTQERRSAAPTVVSAVLVMSLFSFAVVEGFINHFSGSKPHPAPLCATSTATSNDVDVVGEGRRGDARGAALRLVDVAVSRGGSTLLSNIDWRVEPKSKWGLVVRFKCKQVCRVRCFFPLMLIYFVWLAAKKGCQWMR